MGVIKNFDYGRTPPILRSSEESLVSSAGISIPPTPPSEAEETETNQRSQHHQSFNPRRRDPALLLQRLEILTRKRTGARKARREDNARALQTLAEFEEETDNRHSPSIEDFIPKTESPLSKLVTDFTSMKMWEYFMSQSEEEQKKYLDDVSQNKSINRNSAKFGIYFTQKVNETDSDADKDKNEKSKVSSMSAQQRFSCLDAALKNVLKKRNMPNGLLTNLEDDVLDVFNKDGSAVYVSQELTSFQRLLLHAICQYYLLNSCSITVAGSRRTRVKNKCGEFRSPPSTLVSFLDQRKKLLNRS